MMHRRRTGSWIAVAAVAAAMLLTLSVPAGGGLQSVQHGMSITVRDAAGPVAGARVSFVNAHTGETTVHISNSSGGVSYLPGSPAYFKVLVNATGCYDQRYVNALQGTDFVRFDGTRDVDLGSMTLDRLPAVRHAVSLVLEGAAPPGGAQVCISYAGGEQTAYASALAANATIGLPPGEYSLAMRGQGVQPAAFSFTVAGPRQLALPLAASTALTLNVTHSGQPLGSASAYLVSKQKADLGRMLVEPRLQSGLQFVFDAYPGEFYLVVGSPSSTARVVEVALPCDIVTVDLQARARDRSTDTFQISSQDWNSISLNYSKRLQGDSTEPMLRLNRIPDFRMQLDLDPTVGGNANGVVDAQEVYNYSGLMKRIGPDNITTSGLLTIDGLTLISDADHLGYQMETAGLIGTPVSSEAEYATKLTVRYAPMNGTIGNGKSSYILIMNPAYNSTYQGWSYKVRLPGDYVLLGASVYRDPVTVTVSNYTTVTVESAAYRPGDRRPALVSLPVVTAKEPSASVSVVITTSTYRVGQDTYIVRSGVEATFSAAGSFDPNGNPLTYIWAFGDGSSATTTANQVTHVYWMPDLAIGMTLTVRDVSMGTAVTGLTIKADGVKPTATILVNGTAPSGVINVDQKESVVYSASPSFDLIYNEAPPQGIIRSFDWSFGDGTWANGTAVTTHAYQLSGRYNLTSYITDVSGRMTTTTFVVQVRSTQGPEVVVNITRASDGAPVSGSATVGELLLFNGTGSSDPTGIVSYAWDFGDGGGAQGAVAQHAYAAQRTITGRLTCVDTAGNTGYRSFTLTILPAPGPDLRITEMYFSPATFTEGSGGTVTISVVNVGSAEARNVSTGFFLVRSGVSELLSRVSGVQVNGAITDRLAVGQSGQVKASISFAAQGSYTILANATADGETNPGDNTRSATLQVQESAWKYTGIYFGVIFLIVVVILLLYMRRGIGAKKGKGGRKGKGN
jgi:chitodextrinase